MDPRNPHGNLRGFPATRTSIVDGVRSDDPDIRRHAYATLVETYWRPVYSYLRLRWNRNVEDAQDLTQEFLAGGFEKEFLDSYEAGRARLRTFLRVCLDRFVQNSDRQAKRLKRGGDIEILSLDFTSAEGNLAHLEPPAPGQGEEFFEREWLRSFFGIVVEALRQELEKQGKQVQYRLFERYDLYEEEVTYEHLAREFGISVTDVTNRLAATRRAFRRLALERLRELTADENEFRAEARALLGGDPA